MVSFGQGSPLSATYTTTAATCGNYDGSFTIFASGGTTPYTYSFSGMPFQSSAFYNSVPLIPIQVLVKDAAGATFGLTITIPNRKASITISPIVGTETSGSATSNGSVTLQASGGLPPYTYSFDNLNWQSSPTFNSLTPGDYTFFVKDAEGCVRQQMWFDNPSTCSVGGGYETPGYFYAICGAPVSIYVIPRGAPPPLQYSIDNGATWQSDPNFLVNPGQYTITIVDATGTSYLFHIPVFPSCSIAINTSIQSATCGNNDGSITVTASGGTPPYTYSVDGINFQSSNILSGLPAEDYTVLVKGANGIINYLQEQIVNSGCTPFTATAASTNASCTEGDGTITVAAAGGAPPYQYSIDNVNWQAADTFLLSPGSYTVTVMDTRPSTTTADATVAFVDTLTLSPAADLTICRGQTATLATQSNGQQFAWTPATGLNDTTTLQPQASPDTTTMYTLSAMLGSCQASTEVTVRVAPPPDAFIGDDTTIAADQPLPLYVSDVNNSGFTTFSWSPSQGLNDPGIRNPVVTIGQSTTYTVVAATPFGCEATASIAIKVYTTATDIFVPNAFTPNGDGHNDLLKAIPIGIRQFSTFSVFDQWGERVFYTRNAAEGWDGTYKGQRQKAGTYVWMAAGTDYNGHNLVRRGTVILIR